MYVINIFLMYWFKIFLNLMKCMQENTNHDAGNMLYLYSIPCNLSSIK